MNILYSKMHLYHILTSSLAHCGFEVKHKMNKFYANYLKAIFEYFKLGL